MRGSMNNPFVKTAGDGVTKYIDSQCSINRVVLAKLPLSSIEDDIEGMDAKSIFSTRSIVSGIRSAADKCGIDLDGMYDSDLPPFIEAQYMDEHSPFHDEAVGILKKFGHRLGLILLTLKTGLPENRRAREDWQDEHWEFYKAVKKIILVGGLASGNFGRALKKYSDEIFEMAGVEPYELVLFDESSHFGVMGCATCIRAENSANILFDFGQTNIKRAIVKIENSKVVHIENLENRPSWFMMDDITDQEALRQEAVKLHNNLLTIIADTYESVSQRYELGDEIVISIASYTVGGVLNDRRGGYAKLAMLAPNYGNYIEEELRKLLKRNITVRLIHDGTAVAYYFRNEKDAVCMSIGTAFGVGFWQTL